MENKPLIEKSQSITELAKALSKFQGEVEAVPKDSENPFFHSKYASLESVIKVIQSPLAKAGLSYAQFPLGKNQLVTMLMHQSGEFIMSTVEMTPKDTSPQAHGSAITYMRRYSISAMLGLATEEDDDGNSASSPKQKPAKSTTVKTGKVDSQEEFANAVAAIGKLTTVAKLEEAHARLEESDKFTDDQKDKLDKVISERVDVLTIKEEAK